IQLREESCVFARRGGCAYTKLLLQGRPSGEKSGMNSMRLTYKHSRKTLWLGLAGTLVVIVGSILLSYAQTQKKEAEKTEKVMNPTKEVPSDAELRRQLTKDQYHVTREGGTETAFHNAYWDNHKP